MISIIIPNLASPIMDQVVHAINSQTARQNVVEIIVVGPDPTGSLASLAGVRSIVTSRPLSAAAARNLGAREAQGDYLLFLDADCISAPDLIKRHMDCHRAGFPVVGGGVELEPGTYWVQADNALVFAPVLAFTASGYRPYVPSLNFSIRRSLFLGMGGFDERFSGAGGEDMDFCLRLGDAGHRIFCAPHAMVFHRPARDSAPAVWRHLRGFGEVHRTIWTIRATTPGWLARHPWIWSWLIQAGAPLLASVDMLRLYRRHPELWRRWFLLPGMVWGKTAWYWGLTGALRRHAGDIVAPPVGPPWPGGTSE